MCESFIELPLRFHEPVYNLPDIDEKYYIVIDKSEKAEKILSYGNFEDNIRSILWQDMYDTRIYPKWLPNKRFHEDIESYNSDENWDMVGKLKSGHYFYLEGRGSHTGWDCCARVKIYMAKSIKVLMDYGMSQFVRQKFIEDM